MLKYMNQAMLPGNTSTRDDIKIEKKVTAPIGLVIKRPPKLLEFAATSPSGQAEEPKEVSAKDFPLLRGFV